MTTLDVVEFVAKARPDIVSERVSSTDRDTYDFWIPSFEDGGPIVQVWLLDRGFHVGGPWGSEVAQSPEEAAAFVVRQLERSEAGEWTTIGHLMPVPRERIGRQDDGT